MAQINIQLDTSSPNDLKMLARLLDPSYGDVVLKPPFPPIQPSAEPDLPHITPRNEAYEAGVRTLAPTIQPSVDVASLVGTVPAGPTVVESPDFIPDLSVGVREALAVPTPPAPPSGVTLAHESEVMKAAYPAELSVVELDAAGLPWDTRIHSESRARIADGTWRRKRGVDQTLVDSVTAELRAVGQPAPAPAPVAAEVPPPPAAPVVAPPPPAAPAARGVPDLAAAVARGTLSLADLNAACLQHGCANVLELNKNPAALTAVCAQFDAIGAFA